MPMMALKNVILLLALIIFLTANSTSSAREILTKTAGESEFSARLGTNGGLFECWNALSEIKSCSNEILIFFTNGTTDIGPHCCQAITIITRNCWPAMLSALGFTTDETNILRGYCDASSSTGPAQGPSA